jgi:hypothetical protein
MTDTDEQREIDKALDDDPLFERGEPKTGEEEAEITLPGEILRPKEDDDGDR